MNQMNMNEEETVFGLDIGTRNVVGGTPAWLRRCPLCFVQWEPEALAP